MSTQIEKYSGPELKLGTGSLEILRIEALTRIHSSMNLTRRQKRAVAKELHYLVEYERLRRLRRAVWEWQDEKTEKQFERTRRQNQMRNTLRIESRQATLELAKINKQILECKLQCIDMIRSRQDDYQLNTYIRKAKAELVKIDTQKQLTKARQQMLADGLSDQVIHRAKFQQMAEKNFPDMAEELTDFYDQQMFQQGIRRQQ